MSRFVERTTASIRLDNGEELTFSPRVSVWEAMLAKRNAERATDAAPSPRSECSPDRSS